MRMLVCGSRDWTDRVVMFACLDAIAGVLDITEVIEGEQRGADLMARAWASESGISCIGYPADWPHRGKAAGTERNERMLAATPGLVVAFPLPQSRGTWHMVTIARAAGVTTWVMPDDLGAVRALGEGVFV